LVIGAFAELVATGLSTPLEAALVIAGALEGADPGVEVFFF